MYNYLEFRRLPDTLFLPRSLSPYIRPRPSKLELGTISKDRYLDRENFNVDSPRAKI